MTTTKGAWELQDVRDKALAGIWKKYEDAGDPFTMFVWGRNQHGALGQNEGPGSHYSSPVQVPGTTWSRFVQMGFTNLATKIDGTLWAWGNNNQGNLGQNNKTKYSSPVQIPGTTWSRPVGVGNGDNGGCVKSDGTLWMWGYNEEGTVSQNNRTNYSSPRQVGSDTTWSTGQNHNSVADMSVTAIKTDGTLWAWGYSRIYGQLGQNERSNTSSPVQIGTATDWNFTSRSWSGHFAINTSGELYGWGSNYNGCLGYPNAPGDSNSGSRSSPTQIPGTTWVSAAGDSTATLGVKTDGTLWAWGDNNNGYLGQNNRTNRSSPVQIPGTTWADASIGYAGALARKTDGTLWAWGTNVDGALGLNNEVAYSSPVQIPGTTWTKHHDIGNSHGTALKPA